MPTAAPNFAFAAIWVAQQLKYFEQRGVRIKIMPFAIPPWGTMSTAGWQKVINFATGAGIVKDLAKAPSNKEGVLWTNKYVGKP
jgi:hypothetical protein